MSSWTISAIFANVSSAWDRNFSSNKKIQNIEPSVLLREIDEILRKATTLLENHKNIFSRSQYEIFKAQNSAFQWGLTDEERQYGEVMDPKLQQHRTPAQVLAEKEACGGRVADLLENVKTYRSTLLEASRHARLETTAAFPDLEPTRTEPQPVAQAQLEAPEATQVAPPALNPPIPLQATTSLTSRPPSPSRPPSISISPTNVGLIGRLKMQLASSFQNRAQSAGQTLLEGPGFAVIVAHIPVDLANNVYRRQVSIQLGDQQLELCDPQLRELQAGKVDVDDETLAAVFTLIARRVLEPEMFQKTIEELRREID
ncbi:hypothetical protein FRC08_008810 [Ceratobasidium sp. 394]|nr:hypothetical protein FRC08_008810 [Ceratobasidium sp. 394]